MTVSKWYRKIAGSLLAAGLLAPAVVHAVNIPIGDPGFEDFQVPTTGPTAGYAYAGNTGANPHYINDTGPTSAWISRLDDGNYQNGGTSASNWIYNASYAELTNTNFNNGASNPSGVSQGQRPSPRTGNQVMHGRGFLNGQKLSAVFEPGKTYTFSIYAQGDSNAEIYSDPIGWQSRVYLYIFDGTVSLHSPGSWTYDEPEFQTALTHDLSQYDDQSPNFTYFPSDRFAPDEPIPPAYTQIHPGQFINRPINVSAAVSKSSWTQISISWFVAPGSAEVGNPIGVAFKVGMDGAVDDASLAATGVYGDFNGDQVVNSADWITLRSHLFADLTGKTLTEQYHLGNMVGSGSIDQADFVSFKTAYDQVNGVAAFEAMIASLPEPASLTLLVFAGGALAIRRKRQ